VLTVLNFVAEALSWFSVLTVLNFVAEALSWFSARHEYVSKCVCISCMCVRACVYT